MSTKSEKIELALYRSGMLRKNINGLHLQEACKALSRHIARISRWRLAQCNGIDRWDSKAHGFFASWTDEDQARADKETAESKAAIQKALRQFAAPGVVFKWYSDPRAGAVVRLSNKQNTRDCFI